MDKVKLDWFKEQVKGFVDVRLKYHVLAETLRGILEKTRDRYAPMGRVDARAKSIASFAEKALRKYEKYKNPLERMTDLAGARIVVYTLDQARAVCRFIEDEEGFCKDWANSLDVRQQLRTGEFGYEAVHYVVELCQGTILGVSVPPEIQSVRDKRSYKAEIQVHTVLQNAWSTIGHDRIYKTEVKVPETLKREVHSVAATLESVDQALARATESLDRYIHHFEAYKPAAELEDDIDQWKTIDDEVPKDPETIHQLGRRLMAAERWEEAYDALKALKASQRSDVQMDIGRSAWRARPSLVGEARTRLSKAVDLAPPDDWRPECALAETYRCSDLDRAIEHYESAFAIDPTEPAILSPLVECHIRKDRSLVKLGLMQGAFEGSRGHCHERADRGVYVPQAHFNCARLHLYMGKPNEALNSYCLAVATCHLPEMIRDELEALTSIVTALAGGPEQDKRVGFEWARRLLIVALAAGSARRQDRPNEPGARAWKKAGKSVKRQVRALATPAASVRNAFRLPMAIVAGGCDTRFQGELVAKYGRHLQRAFNGFSGTIISGGTTAGISGMVGQLRPSPGRMLHRVAYLPRGKRLPNGDKRSKAYEVRPSPGEGYNPAGVLQAWADILRQKIRPGQVRILGINGGKLTEFELRLGLALGAVVGVVEDSRRAVKTLLDVRTPCRPDGLVPLPTDAATWAAFVRGSSPELEPLEDPKFEPAARYAHAKFCDACRNSHKKHHESVWGWDSGLPDAYRVSNFHQVRFAPLILDALGYDVVPAGRGESLDPDHPPIPPGYEENVKAMAQLEHGRYCAERLVAGWRCGPENNLEKKTNPTLIPWNKLSEQDKGYDLNAVRDYPKWLAAAGMKIVPRSPKPREENA